MSEITELSEKLKNARNAYYNLDPILSDLEYDALKSRLQELDPLNEEIISIGAEIQSNTPWEKIAHNIPMGSLEKVNSKNEFFEWCSNTKSKEFLITHKIDGSSLEVIYEHGKLTKCLSRGDGYEGENITINAIKIPNVPRIINAHEDITVRGEVVMLKSIFKEKYSDEYANPRNTAAGKLRDKKNKGEDCKNLHFFAYTMFGPKLNTEAEQFKTLSNLGFDTPNVNVGDIDMMIQTFESINRENIPYEIDGMVIRINDLQHQASMGEKNMRPLGQIAWKFDPATSVSTVVNIKWQVGPSGRVSPVAVVKPINIGGVEITNISLHNLSMFKDLSLYKNCKVLISKRNDLIPFIEKRIDD